MNITLVTGASAGLGADFARQCSAQGQRGHGSKAGAGRRIHRRDQRGLTLNGYGVSKLRRCRRLNLKSRRRRIPLAWLWRIRLRLLRIPLAWLRRTTSIFWNDHITTLTT